MTGTLLDFDLLDDLALGVERGRVSLDELAPIAAERIGPAIEAIALASQWERCAQPSLHWLNRTHLAPLFRDAIDQQTSSQRMGGNIGWISSDKFADRPSWTCPMISSQYCHPCVDLISSDKFADRPSWTGFLMQVSSAVKAEGFDNRTKSGLMAMLGEFHSNVLEHSDSVEGRFSAYSASTNGIEVIISDRGRGVLSTINENPTYADLKDAGRALKLAVTDGVSRHDDPLRGHGFTHLFEGLANRFNHIRLRSGDHTLEVRREDGSRPSEWISQKASFPGFSIYAFFERAA